MTEKGDYEKEGYLLWRRKAMHTDIRTGVQSRRDQQTKPFDTDNFFNSFTFISTSGQRNSNIDKNSNNKQTNKTKEEEEAGEEEDTQVAILL